MRLGVVFSLREMEGVGFGRARVLVGVKWVVSLLVGVAQVIARQCLRFRAFVCYSPTDQGITVSRPPVPEPLSFGE
jgi:hypothetical protein